ncbi:Ras GTPase-activating protein, putative [Entamoeba histolytica HM-1:IMSS-B]|uniref:Ras GTPase-activating protein, putative n=6 Tax=Entamoeba histolytica TaxID=5759 RepID=B1N2D6_ENTH1|nr:Ras GTPase-activating protein, putative [Entamoeba histolytica HM-1:IMSS]EMD45281.1 Ras GTPase-activating protein, putative [Entamoeba histolytica KU27]EMH74407.1 Ras GTPase-activating protein, putative [Entamoeba histolytica HM-1:IMSS-B]EMS17378.1 Ras GTPase-activating protein, putative [Entamoeba histolytica HM-3:IMSS]ENY63977.1 Ras GTPase-activating protein, putative [Entamoeba histolytica HM-1:IMSS-A]GAT91581.1 Ras GTPase-activating protein putative [Entamoeba histolytica]|eukprot:XP_001913362.1 Ras GTPase-activating protein, putative [Entamoeba histolytica HM-1:IMSS]
MSLSKLSLTSLFTPPFTVLDTIIEFALKNKDTKIADYVYKTLTIANRLELYIHRCVSEEIQGTQSEQTAFRLNSKTTRLLNIIYLNQGIGFLFHCLSPLFDEIEKKKIKIKPLRTCKTGDQDLIICAQLVNMTFQRTISNIDNCPPIVRRVLRKVYDELNNKFPQSNTSWICLGGFIFLRYICPAIIRPLEWGLVYDIPTDMLETYTQISVVLQKVANVKHSDVDDPLGRLTNVLVESRKLDYFKFVTELANVPYETLIEEYPTTTQQFNYYLGKLQDYFLQHKQEIISTLKPSQINKFSVFEQMNFNEPDSQVTLPSIVLNNLTQFPQSIKSKYILTELKNKIEKGQTITLWDIHYLQKSMQLEQAIYEESTKDLVNARYNSYFPGIVTSSVELIYREDYSQ